VQDTLVLHIKDKTLFKPVKENHVFEDFTHSKNLKKQMDDNEAAQNLESGSENLDKALKFMLIFMVVMHFVNSGGLMYMI
jgi:hypothetical protein